MKLLNTEIKNKVLQSMISILESKKPEIIAANKKDLDLFDKEDRAMYDRLIVDEKKSGRNDFGHRRSPSAGGSGRQNKIGTITWEWLEN